MIYEPNLILKICSLYRVKRSSFRVAEILDLPVADVQEVRYSWYEA